MYTILIIIIFIFAVAVAYFYYETINMCISIDFSI